MHLQGVMQGREAAIPWIRLHRSPNLIEAIAHTGDGLLMDVSIQVSVKLVGVQALIDLLAQLIQVIKHVYNQVRVRLKLGEQVVGGHGIFPDEATYLLMKLGSALHIFRVAFGHAVGFCQLFQIFV